MKTEGFYNDLSAKAIKLSTHFGHVPLMEQDLREAHVWATRKWKQGCRQDAFCSASC